MATNTMDTDAHRNILLQSGTKNILLCKYDL